MPHPPPNAENVDTCARTKKRSRRGSNSNTGNSVRNKSAAAKTARAFVVVRLLATMTTMTCPLLEVVLPVSVTAWTASPPLHQTVLRRTTTTRSSSLFLWNRRIRRTEQPLEKYTRCFYQRLDEEKTEATRFHPCNTLFDTTTTTTKNTNDTLPLPRNTIIPAGQVGAAWKDDTPPRMPSPHFPPPTPRTTASTTKPSMKTSRFNNNKKKQFQVYCDLDGVLVDFAFGISQLFPHNEEHESDPEQRSGTHVNNVLNTVPTVWTSQNIDALLPRRLLWDKVKSVDSFFDNLPWCEGGRELWTALAPLRPNILTGVPSYCSWSPRAEKFAWCQRELGGSRDDNNHNNILFDDDDDDPPAMARGPTHFHHLDKAGSFRLHYPVNNNVNNQIQTADKDDDDTWQCTVITCWSERKYHESGPGIVLIDDRIDLRPAWEAQGGIFIHHVTGDVTNTLRQLRQHGILPPPSSSSTTTSTTTSTTAWNHVDYQP